MWILDEIHIPSALFLPTRPLIWVKGLVWVLHYSVNIRGKVTGSDLGSLYTTLTLFLIKAKLSKIYFLVKTTCVSLQRYVFTIQSVSLSIHSFAEFVNTNCFLVHIVAKNLTPRAAVEDYAEFTLSLSFCLYYLLSMHRHNIALRLCNSKMFFGERNWNENRLKEQYKKTCTIFSKHK